MTLRIVLVACSTGIGGFVLGWLVCALMTAGKTEDAYAAGYDQAAHDLGQKSR